MKYAVDYSDRSFPEIVTHPDRCDCGGCGDLASAKRKLSREARALIAHWKDVLAYARKETAKSVADRAEGRKS